MTYEETMLGDTSTVTFAVAFRLGSRPKRKQGRWFLAGTETVLSE